MRNGGVQGTPNPGAAFQLGGLREVCWSLQTRWVRGQGAEVACGVEEAQQKARGRTAGAGRAGQAPASADAEAEDQRPTSPAGRFCPCRPPRARGLEGAAWLRLGPLTQGSQAQAGPQHPDEGEDLGPG